MSARQLWWLCMQNLGARGYEKVHFGLSCAPFADFSFSFGPQPSEKPTNFPGCEQAFFFLDFASPRFQYRVRSIYLLRPGT